MCGIVGAIAQRNVAAILLEGLKRLEYRGYDSAGIAVIHEHTIERLRTEGKVAELDNALTATPLKGKIGIAHTRWATHGAPSLANAHPHVSKNELAVVHNGIIENYDTLKRRLSQQGYEFTSETDTEVIAHLIHSKLSGQDLLAAVQDAVKELVGAYALAIIHQSEPSRIIVVRCGSPLVIGVGIEEHFVASDTLALLPVAQRFIYLEEGDIADMRLDHVKIYDQAGQPVERELHTAKITSDVASRGPFRHFMLKEIYEQPQALANTLEGRVFNQTIPAHIFGSKAPDIFPKVEHVEIIACGTSYHAGLVARYWIEAIAGIPCSVEIASEYRYRHNVVQPNTLFVTLSQSGETADTLAALRKAKDDKYLANLAICNVPESTLVREAQLVFLTRAGVEIGVASTKAFTTQLVSLLMLTLALANNKLTPEQQQSMLSQINHLSQLSEKILTLDDEINRIAHRFQHKTHTLFLGRGSHYPVALEGALKLKEISYIHAEAYPAGELKHGPLALIDQDMPVVAIMPDDELLEKLKSNLSEVLARDGELIIFADQDIDLEEKPNVTVLKLDHCGPLIAPIIFTIPLQLLAYHVAVLKGTDVDQPRNLAKSVTVE